MYLIFFGVGVGFVVLSFIIGAVVDVDGGPWAILQPKLIAVFLTVTGGVGLILSARWEGFFTGGIVLVISVFSGLIVAGLINRFIIVPLHRAQNTSAHDKQATIGTTAKVISPIPEGGYGKIRYSISGSFVTSPAKCEDGGAVKNGENVDIIYIEGGTYYVRRQVVQHSN